MCTRFGFVVLCFVGHNDDVIMGTIASQITSLTIVYSALYSGADQSKHQSSASLAFVWRIHRGPVNSPHKWPVTRKMSPFDDVIMGYIFYLGGLMWLLVHIHQGRFTGTGTMVVQVQVKYISTLQDMGKIDHGPLTRYVKLWMCMRRECRERFPRHHGLAIPTCITVRVWRTCRDACRDR